MRDYADAAAHAAIPSNFLECLLTRRHSFPLARQTRVHVREQYGPRKSDVLEMTEYYGACELCGATRMLWRDRYTNAYLVAEYNYPDGYLAPTGLRWDRDQLWKEFNARNPITGKPQSQKRTTAR